MDKFDNNTKEEITKFFKGLEAQTQVNFFTRFFKSIFSVFSDQAEIYTIDRFIEKTIQKVYKLDDIIDALNTDRDYLNEVKP